MVRTTLGMNEGVPFVESLPFKVVSRMAIKLVSSEQLPCPPAPPPGWAAAAATAPDADEGPQGLSL